MHGTRRYWIGMGITAILALSAVVTARPVLLLGAAMLGASLLAYQYLFVRTLARTVEYLVIEEETDRESLVTEDTTTITLQVTDQVGSPLTLTITSQPPVAARVDDDRTVELTPEQHEAQTSFDVTWPVAGAFQFESPQLSVTDQYGLFTEQLPVEATVSPSITVEPQRPQELHVGRGGDQIGPTYGEHETSAIGAGLEPDVLREYTTTDPANRIDWRTTARMAAPYVREYETDTDRETVLLMDTRSCMAEGPPGETKLDYAKQVGIALADSAHEFNDPLGLYVINGEGITTQMQPIAQRHQYVSIRERLRDLEPDTDPTDPAISHQTPGATRRAAASLTDRSAFATRLRPYLEDSSTQLQQIDRDPLFRTVRSHISPLKGSIWTAIITDDTHRTELQEAIAIARRGNRHVLVFLTPSVLFEPSSLADAGTAYERYLEFEQFRRQLARMSRVSVFEIGPDDRIDTVLTSGARLHRERTTTTSPSNS